MKKIIEIVKKIDELNDYFDSEYPISHVDQQEVLNKLVNFYDNLEDIIEKAIEFDDVNKTKKTLSILNTFLSLEKTYGKNFFTNFINNELLEKLYITSEKQKISQNINTKRNIQKNKISKI